MRHTLVFALAAALLVACGSASPTARLLTSRTRPPSDGLRAGVSVADITPPPGLSLFGHGIEARVARGTLDRLLCQAIVLEAPNDHAALVTCDLAAVSTELVREVARQLETMRVPIAANRIFVMASHTHAGPAHYFPEHGYSGALSTRLTGYDPQVLAWLALRIAAAIGNASAYTVPVELRSGQTEIGDLTLNRSYGAYLHDLPQLSPRAHDGSRAAEAVPRSLSVVRIDRVGGEPLAALSIFGIHNTGIGHRNDLYHADIFGYARRALARRTTPTPHSSEERPVSAPRPVSQLLPAELSAPDRLPAQVAPNVVFALAAGVEGDVSPRVDERTQREAKRIGDELARRIHELWTSLAGAPSSRELQVATRMLHLPGAQVAADSDDRLCEHGQLGMGAAGGAEDGPSGLRLFPVANEGVRTTDPHGCHGRKLIVVPPMQEAGSDEHFFPTYGPAAVLRLGSMLVATLPVEVTTRVGARAIERMRSQFPDSREVAIVGLTNGYLQYVATEEEYDLQQYEGASTLYGPASARFWTEHLGCLAKWLRVPESERVAWSHECGLGQVAVDQDLEPAIDPKVTSRMPADPEVLGDIFNAELKVVETDNEGDRAYALDFWGPPPGYARARTRLRVEVHCTHGDAIVPCDGDGSSSRRADDTDGSVMVRALGQQDGDQHRWRVTWTPDPEALDSGLCEPHRFVVRAHELLVSDPFTPLPHDACDTWRARLSAGTQTARAPEPSPAPAATPPPTEPEPSKPESTEADDAQP